MEEDRGKDVVGRGYEVGDKARQVEVGMSRSFSLRGLKVTLDNSARAHERETRQRRGVRIAK